MPNIVPERLHIVIGVVLSGQGKVLISKRKDSAHQGGLWEFPGGKLEAAEIPERGLARELYEELGITTEHCQPCHQLCHDYPDRSVLLDTWWVSHFSGEPCGREGQPLRWVTFSELDDYDFPSANNELLTYLKSVAASGQVPNPQT